VLEANIEKKETSRTKKELWPQAPVVVCLKGKFVKGGTNSEKIPPQEGPFYKGFHTATSSVSPGPFFN